MGRSASSPPLVGLPTGVYNLGLVYKRSDMIDIELGMGYYLHFRERIIRYAARYGCLVPETACGVYAALSPNNSEESNMEDMIRAVSCFRDPTSRLDERWAGLTVHTYGANKLKAKRILEGESPDAVLKGLKTWNFYHNILEPESSEYVTVDGHMVNIWNGARVPLDEAGISRLEYRIVVAGVVELAERVGIRPCQLQSILWIAWRRLHRIYYKPQYELNLEDC